MTEQNAKPVKRLLNAALIIHIIYNIAAFMIYLVPEIYTRVARWVLFNNDKIFMQGLVYISPSEKEHISSEMSDIMLLRDMRTVIDMVVLAVVFIAVYIFLRRYACSGKKSLTPAGVLLLLYALSFRLAISLLFHMDMTNAEWVFDEYVINDLTSYDSHYYVLSFLSILTYLEQIAIGLMLMAFGMLWYRDRIYKNTIDVN